MLDGRAIERTANLLEQRIAVGAYIAPNANFDELVRLERNIDFMQHAAGQSVGADRDDRMKVMRPGA